MTAEIFRWPRHVRYRCPPGRDACIEGRCAFCSGGLFVCSVCTGGEGELPTDCPGEPMAHLEMVAVLNGHLDYRWDRAARRGRWVCTSEEARRPLGTPGDPAGRGPGR